MLRIGLATRDITPTRPAVIPGQMHIRIGRASRDPLTVTVMALDGRTPDGRVVIISCDRLRKDPTCSLLSSDDIALVIADGAKQNAVTTACRLKPRKVEFHDGLFSDVP